MYFSDLAAQIAPDLYQNGNPVYYVNEAIQKLQGMTRYDGAFSYWPGGSYTSWWGSVYATHFLVEAQKAGYQVNQNILDQALNYLVQQAADRDTYEYVYYDRGVRKVNRIARKEVIYSLYVLALAGKPEVSFMNYYRARPNLLSRDTRYLLAGAFGLSKNWSVFNELIPQSFESEKTDRLSGGSFDSEYRANAIMLNVLMDVDPNNDQIPIIVRYLAESLPHLWSTQDRAWTYLGLGKVARKLADSDLEIAVQVDGNIVGVIEHSRGSFFSSDLNGKRVTLRAKGTGQAYYSWSTEGIKADGVTTEEDMNLSVRRKFYDRTGNPITNGRFKQGDLIVAEVHITGGSRTVENVAVSDLIPSGFEIENPRLGRSANLSWVEEEKDRFTPTYLDVRDDRLLLFTNVPANRTMRYFYMLRVVNSGNFQLPAIGAEAMYDPNYRSYHGASRVKVD